MSSPDWAPARPGELTVWRIVAGRYRDRPYDGEGARLHGGRWNHPGVPAVYASTHLSLAALELFVHLDPDLLPDDLVAVPARVPEDLRVDRLSEAALPTEWRAYPAPEAVQELGTTWLRNTSAALLLAPSAVLPRETNAILNPAHPELGRIEVGEPEGFAFDPRMWK